MSLHPVYCKLFKWDFSYSCAAVDEISTDMARRKFTVAKVYRIQGWKTQKYLFLVLKTFYLK